MFQIEASTFYKSINQQFNNCSMRSSKSFANEYGITQKSIASNPSLGIGLNPNLNIEDQYIENLLKQTHFLNMEIKLIKEKQKENKGMGIMGLLNKDQNPVVTHAVTSNAKYSEMKNGLASMVNEAEADYIRLDDQNFAVKAQRDFSQKLSLKEEQVNIKNKLSVDEVLGKNREKLNEQSKKLKEVREENRRTVDLYQRLSKEWEDTTSKNNTKNLFKAIATKLEGEVEQLREKHQNENLLKLNQKRSKVEEADRLFREDVVYKKLEQENTDLKEKVKKADKDLFDMNYKAKEMEELKKLSLRNKDVQTQLKKQALEESERLKKKLGDKNLDLADKIKDAKNGLESNDEVRLAKGKLARKDKQISDLKKKTEISETNYKRLRDEVMKIEGNIVEKKKTIAEKKKKKDEKIAEHNVISKEENESRNDYEKSVMDEKNARTTHFETRERFEALDEELAYLIAKEQFLMKEIKIDDGIKSVKIDKLTALVSTNSGLNDTIGDLMKRWEQIITFSREPPGI